MSTIQQEITNIEKTIATKLVKLRKYMGINLSQMATILDMDEQELQDYETANEPIPASTLVLIAAICQVDLDYFYAPEQKVSQEKVLVESEAV